MKIASIKQPLHLFILSTILLSSISLETFCVRKPSEIQQIRRERKQNEKRLNVWTGVSFALIGVGIYLVASTFPPTPTNQLAPTVQPIPLSSAHGIHLDPSMMNPPLLKQGKKK